MTITYQTHDPDHAVLPDYGLEKRHHAMIREMELHGATVVLNYGTVMFTVKVRQPGRRQIRATSTNGYPVRGAFDAFTEVRR